MMGKDRPQGYVASLEQIMKNTHLDLKEAMDQFEELCHKIAAESNVPMEMITGVRKTYKEIQDYLTKIKGVHQLLEAKYRLYYRRDPQRDKEIMEFGSLAKNLYSKLEYALQEIEAKKKLNIFPWFQSKQHQIILLRNLRSLYDLDYGAQSDLEFVQRREILRNGPRSISLFILSGEVALIDNLQSRLQLREHDIKERYTKGELRGALTHLREISPSEVERVLQRFMDSGEASKLKCLLFSIQSQKDLKKEILGSAKNILDVMAHGEMRTLSV
jgi:hypothetical protein